MCVCVITVRSLVVIIHDIQLPHKLHIQARLQISGSKRANVQYILALLLVKYYCQGRKREENVEKSQTLAQKLRHTVRWRVEIKWKEGVKLRYREQEKATRAV